MDQDQKAEKPADQSLKLPERDFFSGNKLNKFADELGVFEGDKPKDQPKPEAASSPKKGADEKPCPGCPPKEDASKPKADAAPYKVLKVAGRDVPVRDEAHLLELAQQGVDYTQKRQRDADWERSLTDREAKLEAMRPILEKIQVALDKGDITPEQARALAQGKPLPESTPITDEEDEEPLDPAAAKKLKKLEAELASLREFSQKAQKKEAESETDKLRSHIETQFAALREKYPIEEIVDPETGVNSTKQMIAGLMAAKAQEDQITLGRMRSVDEYMEETLRDVSRHQGKGSGTASVKSAADLAKSYPDFVEEIRQSAVAEFLRKQEETPAAPRARIPVARTPQKGKEGFASLDDALQKAMSDEVIEGEINKIALRSPS